MKPHSFFWFARWCVLVLLASAVFVETHAAVISVDFTGENPAPFLAPTDVAGVVPAANWNGFAGTVGSPAANLLDSTGTPSSVILGTYFANNDVKRTLPANPSTTQKLFGGYIDSPTNGGVGFTISNIPFATYDLYVYVTADNPNRRGYVTTTEAGTPDFYYVTTGAISDSFVQITSTSSAEYSTANYALFEDLTATSQTVTLDGLNTWSGIAGFQIVNTSIPEPGATGLLAFGLSFVLGIRRRRLR